MQFFRQFRKSQQFDFTTYLYIILNEEMGNKILKNFSYFKTKPMIRVYKRIIIV